MKQNNIKPLKALPFIVKFSIPHSNIIQPHFSWLGPIRATSGTACWSVSSTKVNSSNSSKVKRTFDFPKGMAVIAQVPISVKINIFTTFFQNGKKFLSSKSSLKFRVFGGSYPFCISQTGERKKMFKLEAQARKKKQKKKGNSLAPDVLVWAG